MADAGIHRISLCASSKLKGSSVISFVPANESKEQIFRYLLRVFAELRKAKIIQSDLEKAETCTWAAVLSLCTLCRELRWKCCIYCSHWSGLFIKHSSYCPCSSIPIFTCTGTEISVLVPFVLFLCQRLIVSSITHRLILNLY